MLETPAWFIADSTLTSVGEKRAATARQSALATLQQIFPDTNQGDLEAAVAAGGDLTTIVDRVLATQLVDEEDAALNAGPSASDPSCGAEPSAATAPGPKRRVRFNLSASGGLEPTRGLEQMTCAGCESGGTSSSSGRASSSSEPPMTRLSDEELNEQMAASGIRAEPTAGSARGAAVASTTDSAMLGGVLQSGTFDELQTQSVQQLASGALRLDARVIKTANELEEGFVSDKVVTKFVIEVQQLHFRWEVRRRYSEFHRFHELLSLQWSELPPLPPKFLISQDVDDVAERMLQLDAYLRALLAAPALALSPLVCTFLDAVDVQSFRLQMLPRLQGMPQMEVVGGGAPPIAMESMEDTY